MLWVVVSEVWLSRLGDDIDGMRRSSSLALGQCALGVKNVVCRRQDVEKQKEEKKYGTGVGSL